jgi:hypothetical protein
VHDAARHRKVLRPELACRLLQGDAVEPRVGGEEHGALARLRDQLEGGGVLLAGRGVIGDALHDFERDHFARDLGKALDPAMDGEVPVIIQVHDIAGVVPALSHLGVGRLQFAGPVVKIVATHDVGAADVEHAAAGNAGHRHQLMLDAREHAPNRARLVAHRRIEGEHRRALGRTVAFHDAQPEPIEPQVRHLRVELFRARYHDSRLVEIVGMRLAGVMRKEGAGAEHVGAAARVGKLRDHFVMQRRGVQVTAGAGKQRLQRARCQAVRVVHGQRVQEPVVGPVIDDRAHLRDVGEQRAVTQRDTFGPRLRA